MMVYEHADEYVFFKDDVIGVHVPKDSDRGKEIAALISEHPEALVPEPVPPPPTQEELDRREMAQLLAYLASTDWYVIRGSETGVMIPADVLEKRSDARQRISEIRGALA